MVDFCENCGAILVGKKGEVVKCPSCGKESISNSSISLKEKVERKETTEILDNSSTIEINPTTNVECPSCGNKEAYYWTKQTRASDEPETQFFKCVSCSHQWREYR